VGPPHDDMTSYLRLTVDLTHRGVLLGGSSPARSTLVMLRRTNSPMTGAWRPSPDRATLLVTAEELAALTVLPDPTARSVGQTNVKAAVFASVPATAPTGPDSKPVLELPMTMDGVCAVEMEPELATQLYNSQLPAINTMLLGRGWFIHAYPADRGPEMKLPHIVAPADPAAVIDAAISYRTPVPS
jgi:hypothetical protein